MSLRFTFLLALAVISVCASQAAPTLSLPASIPGSSTTTPDKISNQPWLSTDGRYLTFASNATNLISGFVDNNEASQGGGASDLYQRDLQTGTITLITHAAGSTTSGMNSRTTGQMRASSDGRYVFFMSDSTDLVTGQGGGQRGYIWDRTTNTSTLYIDKQCGGGTLSADGNWIAVYITDGGSSGHTMPKNVFNSSAGNYNLALNYAGYLINRTTGAVTMMTHAVGNANSAAVTDVQSVLLSSDGRYCAFETSPVVSGWDTFTGSFGLNSEALYVYDRQNDSMALVSKMNTGAAFSSSVTNPTPQSISADGRYVLFTHTGDISFGGSASADSNAVNDLYIYDRLASSANTRVLRLFFDLYPLASAPTALTTTASFSPNNRYVVFLSPATNLVSGDTNGRSDLFRFDTTTSTMERVNVTSAGAEWTVASNGSFTNSFPRVDDSGNVLFVSTATGLGFTDSNAAGDIFLATYATANTAPSISDVANQSVSTGAATSSLAITIGDTETAVAALTMSGSSNNTTLVPNANIAFGGSGASRTVTVTPAAGQTGTATITLTVTDGGSLTATDTFILTVSDTTPPTVTSIVRRPAATPQATNSTSATFRVTFSEAVNTPTTTNFAVAGVGNSVAGTVDGVTFVSSGVYDVAVTITAGTGEFRLLVKD